MTAVPTSTRRIANEDIGQNIMRVAHIAFMYGTKDVGGACIAATRLHKALTARGVESHFLCWSAAEEGVNVHVLPRTGLRRVVYYLLTRITHYALTRFLFGRQIPLNVFRVFGLEKTLREINPDVVHIQWMNEDFPAFEQVARIPYPVVYSLHDLFSVNAVDAYPCDDGRFIEGFLRDNSTFLERWLFSRKKNMLSAHPGVFIGPSDWVCREAKSSLLGRDCPHRRIPNIIDSAFFNAGNKAFARNSRFTILFGAHGGRSNPLKGFDDLVAALELLPREVKNDSELVIFGESGAACETAGILTRFAGVVSDPVEMSALYHAADVFAFPSRQETQGMVKVEALACGTPVVAFERTGCGEGIVHGVNGWLAPDGDSPCFADGIAAMYRLWKTGELAVKRVAIAEKAAASFAAEAIVDQFIAVYREAMRRRL